MRYLITSLFFLKYSCFFPSSAECFEGLLHVLSERGKQKKYLKDDCVGIWVCEEAEAPQLSSQHRHAEGSTTKACPSMFTAL